MDKKSFVLRLIFFLAQKCVNQLFPNSRKIKKFFIKNWIWIGIMNVRINWFLLSEKSGVELTSFPPKFLKLFLGLGWCGWGVICINLIGFHFIYSGWCRSIYLSAIFGLRFILRWEINIFKLNKNVFSFFSRYHWHLRSWKPWTN